MRSEIFITSFMSCSTSTTAMPLSRDLPDQAVDLLGLDRVAAGGRLVEQQDARLGGQRAGDLQTLAARHREASLPATSATSLQADIGEEIAAPLRASPGSGASRTAVLNSAGRRLRFSRRWRPTMTFSQRRHALEDLQVLEGARQAARRELVGRQAGHVLAVEVDRAAARRVDAGDDVEQRGLAGAVRADDREDLAGVDGEAHAIDGFHAAKGDADVRCLRGWS